MSNSSISLAQGILRNSAALILVGVISKGAGLVIVVLVARFLGPAATGLFAMLFGIALLVENITAVGLQDTLVREVAANPHRQRSLFRAALRLVGLASLLPALGFFVVSFMFSEDPSTRIALVTLAINTPCTAAFVVAQATLQGAERVLLLTWTVFLARILTLAWLALTLFGGAGVEAAFQSRLAFHVVSLAVLIPVILRHHHPDDPGTEAKELFIRSVPFAFHRALYDLTIRSPVMILPLLLGFAGTGLFDAADRIRQTLSMTLAAARTAMMPAFARSFAGGQANTEALVAYSAKYTCLSISMFATAISVGSGWIINLLYGNRFAAAALPLQLLVWAQVIVAVDAVFKQAMLAGGREYAVVVRSLLALAAQVILIIVLGLTFKLLGVALAIVATAVLALALDLQFMREELIRIDAERFVLRPILAAFTVGGVLLLIDDRALLLRLAVALGCWVFASLGLRLLTLEEVRFFRDMVRSWRGRSRFAPRISKDEGL
jgi:O-antigen/teichoic acid export membrane protein